MFNYVMTYTVKVKFPVDNSLEVSGDELDAVVVLVNSMTKKFFPTTPVADVEIIPN
jgi:hypothetical protein